MRNTSYIIILCAILLLSVISAWLLYSYLDPEKNLSVAYATMGLALWLGLASLSGLTLYAFKRVYYRGIVSAAILHGSVRQGFLIASSAIGLVIFFKLGILNWRTGGLLLFIVFLFELMIQSIVEDN
jgi:hypothetical protein